MTTTTRMSAPTPKSMPWPTPQRPAQAAPVRRGRRELFQPEPGGGEPCGGGIHPAEVGRMLVPFSPDDSD